jgi:putative transposase
MVYLWRAIVAEGEVLDVLVHKHIALKLMRKLLKKYASSLRDWSLTTCDHMAQRARALGIERLHEQGRWRNNRIENSHQPTRRQERKMQRLKRARSAQKFVSTHPAVYNILTSNAISYQINRTACYAPRR